MNWLLLQCLWKKLNLKTLSFTEYIRAEAVNLDHHKGTIWKRGEIKPFILRRAGYSRISSKLVNPVKGAFFELKCGKDNYSKLTTPWKRSNDFFVSCLAASPFCNKTYDKLHQNGVQLTAAFFMNGSVDFTHQLTYTKHNWQSLRVYLSFLQLSIHSGLPMSSW